MVRQKADLGISACRCRDLMTGYSPRNSRRIPTRYEYPVACNMLFMVILRKFHLMVMVMVNVNLCSATVTKSLMR